MSEHAGFVVLAYVISFLTIGGVALRIVLDYRRLRDELSHFNAAGRSEAGDDA
jgi:heme exporter protein D